MLFKIHISFIGVPALYILSFAIQTSEVAIVIYTLICQIFIKHLLYTRSPLVAGDRRVHKIDNIPHIPAKIDNILVCVGGYGVRTNNKQYII